MASRPYELPAKPPTPNEAQERAADRTHHVPSAFGAMPVTAAKPDPKGERSYTPIGRGSAAANAAIEQRHQAKYAPRRPNGPNPPSGR